MSILESPGKRSVNRMFACSTSIVFFFLTSVAFGQASVESLNSVKWAEVGPTKRAELLEMMAEQMEGNFSKIKTWKGAYDVSMTTLIPAEHAKAMVGEGAFGENEPVSVQQKVNFKIEFAMDIALNSIFRSKKTSSYDYEINGSGKALDVETEPLDENSVLSTEHFLSLGSDVYSSHADLPNHPETHRKRACYRKAFNCISANGMGLSDLLDPRDFFGFNNQKITYAGDFRFYARDYDATPLGLAEGTLDGNLYYRFTVDMADTEYVAYVSAASGFHPVVVFIGPNRNGEEAQFLVETTWESVGGVWVPSRQRRVHKLEDGSVGFRRDAKLLNPEMNPELDEHQFDYVGLGLKEGEVIMDRIENVAYTLGGDGNRVKVAAFGDKYTPPTQQTSFFRRIAVGVAALLVFGLVAIVLRNRAISA